MDWFRIKHSIGLCLCSSGRKRAEYLKRHKIFKHVGDNCMIMSRKIPLYPQLISVGNNVWIASHVDLVTHDVIHRMLNNMHDDEELQEFIGCIEINDNVFIGSNTTILPNVKIGSNVVVGAGCLVNKSLPSNSVYAGVPARRICSFEDIVNNRRALQSIEISREGKGGLSGDTVKEAWDRFLSTNSD